MGLAVMVIIYFMPVYTLVMLTHQYLIDDYISLAFLSVAIIYN